MQQLNVLPVNVPQNVEVKDDAAAPSSAKAKDDFSQHIDSHLAKNREVSDSKNNVTSDNVDSKKDQTSIEEKSQVANEKSNDSSNTTRATSDEKESASVKQEVAASGKNEEKESSVEKQSDEHQTVDESELLMSFLTKADKTLVEDNSTGEKNIDEMSAEQKAKHEAQLLLKSSDLVADLSGVAKAVTSNSEAESSDLIAQEKTLESLLSASKGKKSDNESSQLKAKDLVEGSSSEEESPTSEISEKSNKENSASQQANAVPLNKKGATDSLTKTIKPEELTQNSSAQHIAEVEGEVKISNQDDAESGKVAQKELGQQSVIAAGKSLDSNEEKESSKSSINVQTTANTQNPLEVESKINDQIAQLIQNENGTNKPENSLASAINVAQNANNNKNVSTTNSGQTKAESIVKQGSAVDSDVELAAKSAEHESEQSKELGGSESKDVSSKVATKANTNFAINSSFSDSTSRTTQAAYDRIDQQAAEIFNTVGSSEVSQSQKTNTQLHQEVISIFRRDFSDAVKDKVMLMISQKLQQFDITLDPPELGNMQVRVNLQGEQASVNFIVQNQQAKDALEQNMHKLRDSLAEQGVDVGDANVEQQSQQSDKDDTSGDNQNNLVTNTADASDVIEHNFSARMFDSSSTAVDYYA